jgi:SynChlorMet cassette protein ScmC
MAVMYLPLKNGDTWCLQGGNAPAAQLVSRLEHVMTLDGLSGHATHRVDVDVTAHPEAALAAGPYADSEKVLFASLRVPRPPIYSIVTSEGNGRFACLINSYDNEHQLLERLLALSLVLARGAETAGGLLLHGALAERDGRGVLLVGPPGMGKSTASGRLPPPWISHSDDATLVVRDQSGRYWAHPWPTWSRLMFGRGGGRWRTAKAVPLNAVFVLARGPNHGCEPVGVSDLIGHLVGASLECTCSRATATQRTFARSGCSSSRTRAGWRMPCLRATFI